MQAYAEGLELIQHKTEFGLDLHQIAEIWLYLFNLYCKGRLPSRTQIVGFAFTKCNRAEFQTHLREGIEKFAGDIFIAVKWDEFAAKLWYAS
jgi:glucose-6-phosphate 1-dehydrogenase